MDSEKLIEIQENQRDKYHIYLSYDEARVFLLSLINWTSDDELYHFSEYLSDVGISLEYYINRDKYLSLYKNAKTVCIGDIYNNISEKYEEDSDDFEYEMSKYKQNFSEVCQFSYIDKYGDQIWVLEI